ncbi:hypothetical protein ACTXT7_003574 [Hymenolepis weldensis]
MWKSGVFLLVNITHVALSRVYEEVPHKGDNEYFLQTSKGPERYENNQLEFQRSRHDLAPDTTITNEMKRHAVLVSIKANHNNLEIARFVQVSAFLACKVRKEVLNVNNQNELAAIRKRK